MNRISGLSLLASVSALSLSLVALPGCGRDDADRSERDDPDLEMADGVDEDEGEESQEGRDEAEADTLPEAVESAFRASYPDARVLTASSEMENGEQVYEIESMDGSQRRDLVYHADGTVAALEEIVDASTLPALVRAAAEAAGRIVQAERVVEGSREFFEIVVERDGARTTLELDTDGRPATGG